jgi:putative nucleotidyltransferase with HDIG domain
MKVMELTRNPGTEISHLEHVIQGDPALTTKVLRTVNSSAYALRERVGTLHQALSYIGYHSVRNMAMQQSVSKLFQRGESLGPYVRSDLWRHMVSVGLCARMVARHIHMENPEDAYLAGLLHDLGIILADQYDHSNFKRLMKGLQEGVPLPQQELEVLGYDHTQLGSRVARAWKLPEFISTTLRFHHASHACPGETATVARTVEVANFICTAKGITSVGYKLCRPMPEIFQALDLSKDDLTQIVSELDAEFERHQDLFELQ